MKIPDPLTLKLTTPKEATVIAAIAMDGGLHPGAAAVFSDECIAVAQALSEAPAGKIAVDHATETAVWAYKHVRTRPFYWEDKKLFMKRIYRTVNLSIWQKQKDPSLTGMLQCSLLVMLVGPRNFWIGAVGDCQALVVRDGTVTRLVRDERSGGQLVKPLGKQRLGITPQFVSNRFLAGDVVLLATSPVTDYLFPADYDELLRETPNDAGGLATTLTAILERARVQGSPGDRTACLIKRSIAPHHFG